MTHHDYLTGLGFTLEDGVDYYQKMMVDRRVVVRPARVTLHHMAYAHGVGWVNHYYSVQYTSRDELELAVIYQTLRPLENDP